MVPGTHSRLSLAPSDSARFQGLGVCLGFRVWGLGFGVWGLGFGVWGLGFGVWSLEFGVWGLGFNLGFFSCRVSLGDQISPKRVYLVHIPECAWS